LNGACKFLQTSNTVLILLTAGKLNSLPAAAAPWHWEIVPQVVARN
jgi:hypothetical protein